MKKDKELESLKKWISDTNQVRAIKLRVVGGFEINEDGDEYVAVETDSQKVYFGNIQLMECYSGLHFFGVRLHNGKIQILLSRNKV